MRIKKVHLYTVGGLITLFIAMTIAIPLVLAQLSPPPCGECGISWEGSYYEADCYMAECHCIYASLGEGSPWAFVSAITGTDECCEACLVGAPVPGLSKAISGAIWLADVCEPNDGFSDEGGMTWDSRLGGPLEFAASMEGPWYAVEVNGPPWVLTEENMESFAAMVGVDDWHDMWVRANNCYPQHVGNAVAARDARMDTICE
jgi:hypothetical protein